MARKGKHKQKSRPRPVSKKSIFRKLIDTNYDSRIVIVFESSERLYDEEQYGIEDWSDWRIERAEKIFNEEPYFNRRNAEAAANEEYEEIIWSGKEKIWVAQRRLIHQSHSCRTRYSFSNFIEVMTALGIECVNDYPSDLSGLEIEHIYREGDKIIFGVASLTSVRRLEVQSYLVSDEEKAILLEQITKLD
jgi:hypothetical protein